MRRPNQLPGPRVREELVNAYLHVQQQYEDEGQNPKDEGTVFSRYRGLWETMGAIHVGLLVAAVTLLLNFIVINIIFHLAPS